MPIQTAELLRFRNQMHNSRAIDLEQKLIKIRL